ncbi:MAG: FAD-dependent oxidoreductase [Pseudomonadota bacterium]
MDKYDVVVIGSGPAGYIAAIRCAQLGMTAACVEQWRQPDGSSSLGGTCLNVGCIPSKALLDSSHHYTHMQKHAADHGIEFDNLSIDVSTMLQRKDKIVGMLTKGIEGLFKKNKVTDLRGKGRLLSGTF